MAKESKTTKSNVIKAEIKPSLLWYESREKEPTMFDWGEVGSIRNESNGKLLWKIKPSEKDRMESHHFFQVNRIIRKAD